MPNPEACPLPLLNPPPGPACGLPSIFAKPRASPLFPALRLRPARPPPPRIGDEEALCAICGDGTSLDPNMIVFCERCDVAVHQRCYGVDTIPAGEWLCWPCHEYEAQLRRRGKSPQQIRPPRWAMTANGSSPSQLPVSGGEGQGGR